MPSKKNSITYYINILKEAYMYRILKLALLSSAVYLLKKHWIDKEPLQATKTKGRTINID